MDYIVVIVEGDVAFSIPVPTEGKMRELMISAYLSNPTFVLHDKDLVFGSEWDGANFTKIVERPVYTGPSGEIGDFWDGEKFVSRGQQ